MPVNLDKGKGAIAKYRDAHTLLHENPVPRLSEAHDPLTFAMRDELKKWGFSNEEEVYIASCNEVLASMGYASKEEFHLAVHDYDGNTIPGKESDDATWEARWK